MIPPDVKAVSNMGKVNDLMATRTRQLGRRALYHVCDPEYLVQNCRETSLCLCTVEALFLECGLSVCQ